jgi:hypothetical protein
MASGGTGVYGFPYPIQTDPVDVAADIEDLANAIDAQFVLTAPLLSPQFTGIPLSVTPNTSDNSTKIATTAYVKSQNYLTTTSAASTYAPIASPIFTGTVTFPLTTAGIVTTTAGGVIGSTTILPIANGGTNTNASPTLGGISYGTGTAIAYTTAGSSGQFLQSTGTGAPVWANVIGSLYQSDAPSTPQIGALWTDSDTDVIYVWNGSTWHSPAGIERNVRGASYTLVLSDRSKLIEMGVGAANTLTIPPNSSAAFPIGTQITVLQTSSGQTTLAPGSGVTLNGTPGLKLRTQWSSATLIKRGTDTWVALGDLAA